MRTPFIALQALTYFIIQTPINSFYVYLHVSQSL